MLLLTGGLYYVFDFSFWSGRYVFDVLTPEKVQYPSVLLTAEKLRATLFLANPGKDFRADEIMALKAAPLIRNSISAWDLEGDLDWDLVQYLKVSSPVQYLTNRQVAELDKGTATRMAFLGSSQTFGVGAEKVEDVFVARVHRRLAEEIPNLETLNFSIPGATTNSLWPLFAEYWIKSGLDLLVVNLSNNDDPLSLADNLAEIAAAAHEQDVVVLFSLEANTVETNSHNLAACHKVMREVAARFKIDVIDLHSFMTDENHHDQGFFWWDRVHLSNAGHAKAAERISRALLKKLSTDESFQ